MLELRNSTFSQQPSCSKPINQKHFTEENIKCFDNDGFELTLLEQAYYTQNGFFLQNHLNHNCLQHEWFVIKSPQNFILDHALLLERKSFTKKAREQIENNQKDFPQLKKYLYTTPKWGIDFSLEYYEDDLYFEVLHIEYDYQSYDEALNAKESFEKKLLATDWNDFVNVLKNKKDHWMSLKGFDQNNWKALFWGLPKAEATVKSFAVDLF